MTVEKTSVTSEPKPTREGAAMQLTVLRKQYGEKASALSLENEAKTRLLLINCILQGLGWSRDDFNPEHPTKPIGFIDYLISVDDIPRFIVEAKRVGYTFAHPQSGMKKNDYQLSYIRSAFGPAVGEVIDQAERYSKNTGVPYAVITNGAEWLLIQSIPYRNKSVNDLRCVYFGNLLSDASNFELFWELLAKHNVLDGSLEEYFSQLNSLPAEFCAVPSKELPELHWARPTEHEKYLRDFYDRFFDEITDPGRRNMLKHCFVTNSRLDQYQGDLKRILRDTAPSYIPDAIEITSEDHEKLLPRDSGDQKGRVILVTGSVGCGKSTLVTKVLVEARQNKQLICLVIDLIDEVSGNADSTTAQLWHEIDKKWREAHSESYEYETLRKIFDREIQALRKGSMAKAFEQDETLFTIEESKLLTKLSELPTEFLEKSWRYYSRQSGNGVIVFLDNVDRTSEEYQRLVYAFAHKVARQTGATVMITMREVTYFRGQEFGFLDVRSSDTVFHLQTPDLVQILSKRIRYVETLMDSDHRVKRWRSQANWQQFQNAALKYVEVLKSTFLTSQFANRAISLLSAVAWHDVRYFLKRLYRLHLMLGSDSGAWSISEIIAALMMPTSMVENQSTLANLYLPSYASYPCYFLKPRILLMLLHGRRSSEAQRGTGLRSILGFARMYGYHEQWIRRAVKEMVRERLLECLEAPSAADYTKDYELQENHSFRASPIAVTVLEQVQFDHVYLSMLGNKLPFHRQTAFELFVTTIREVMDLLAGAHLDRNGVNLLSETEACRVVAQYLVDAFEDEQPLSNAIMQIPEVAVTEQKLRSIVDCLLSIAGMPTPDQLPNITALPTPVRAEPQQVIQLSLFDSAELGIPPQFIDNVQVPDSLTDIHRAGSQLAPKILWALVKLRARKKTLVTGAEIARVINQYLVDDLNKVESTNISKALRGKTLQSQTWLITNNTNSKRKLYGLSDDWRHHWQELFKEAPPNLA